MRKSNSRIDGTLIMMEDERRAKTEDRGAGPVLKKLIEMFSPHWWQAGRHHLV